MTPLFWGFAALFSWSLWRSWPDFKAYRTFRRADLPGSVIALQARGFYTRSWLGRKLSLLGLWLSLGVAHAGLVGLRRVGLGAAGVFFLSGVALLVRWRSELKTRYQRKEERKRAAEERERLGLEEAKRGPWPGDSRPSPYTGEEASLSCWNPDASLRAVVESEEGEEASAAMISWMDRAGKPVRRMKLTLPIPGPVTAVCFGPGKDELTLASAWEKGQGRIFVLGVDRKVRLLLDHEKIEALEPTAVEWSPQGDLLACIDGGSVAFYEPDQRQVLFLCTEDSEVVRHISWSPDGSRFAFRYEPDGEWQIVTRDEIKAGSRSVAYPPTR